MTTHRLNKVLLALLVSAGVLGGTTAAVQANTLDSILEVGAAKNEAARKSQAKIDRLAISIADGNFDTIDELPWTTEVRNVALSPGFRLAAPPRQEDSP